MNLGKESSNVLSSEMSDFANTIYEQKYAWRDEEGNVVENWSDTAYRVVENVLGALGYSTDSEEFNKLYDFVKDRKFIPGGRYLYASGRDLHQTQNCLLLKAEDSREGWADLLAKSAMALQTGAGIGVDYSGIRASNTPIKRTGGVASGPIPLMKMINEIGRGVMQGGARRSAIWAGLNWSHPDCEEFIRIKDWRQEVRDIKAVDFNFPADMEFTNVSILLDDEFFAAYEDKDHEKHKLAHHIYHLGVQFMVKTAEPGFSVDIGDNAGETLRNAPVAAGTHVLTDEGYKTVGSIVDQAVTVWTGRRWAEDVIFSKTQENAQILKVKMTGGREIRCEPNHEFFVEKWVGAGSRRKLDGIAKIAAKNLASGDQIHVSLPFGEEAGEVDNEAYTLGYIYGDGSFHKSGGVDLTLCTDESKNCVGSLVGAKSINERDGRGFTRLYFSADDRWSGRNKEEFPLDVYEMNFDGIRSFIAGLFDADGNYEPRQKRIRLSSKHEGFLRGVARALEQIGILANVSKAGRSTYGKSQIYQLVIASDSNQDFAFDIPTQRIKPEVDDYVSYRRSAVKVMDVMEDGIEDVYCADVHVPEHSFMAEGVIISNCCEVTSHDDSDICNLGSINLARIADIDEMREVVRYGTLFLLAGTVYSHLPYDKVKEVRAKNRRLGLGVMGVHEWLLKKGKKYGPDTELGDWLDVYTQSTNFASDWAAKHSLNTPVKTRAIAPTGTIGIMAETTTGIEPIFCVAFKRRYKEAKANGDDIINYQYVIDPTAKRLIDEGVDPEAIEDAYTLAFDVERRIAMQAWMQRYVDHGISSTINLPYPITDPTEVADFADLLYGYLPQLRGITCYPDGSRGGQPFTISTYEEAKDKVGVVYEEDEAKCVGGLCGV